MCYGRTDVPKLAAAGTAALMSDGADDVLAHDDASNRRCFLPFHSDKGFCLEPQ